MNNGIPLENTSTDPMVVVGRFLWWMGFAIFLVALYLWPIAALVTLFASGAMNVGNQFLEKYR